MHFNLYLSLSIYIYIHIIILLKTTLKLGTTGYELHGTGVSDRFGKGPHPLLWANSRPECVQTTIRLIPKQLCNFTVYIIYKTQYKGG
jgi:hypothetical protein